MKRLLGFTLAAVLVMIGALAPSALAQSTGNIYGTITDESGAVLPGVNVRLTSPLSNRETTSDAAGNFRFLSLDHGTYTLTASLTGFSTVSRSVGVEVAENVTVPFLLKVAAVGETVTVTSETSMIDSKKTGTALTMTDKELSSIPSARDPWAMLRAVPGITMDRVNVGGNENGQQAGFTSKGDNGNNVMWNLDGLVITDVSSLSSPSYYDFDAFDEVSVGTGGNPVTAQTGGVNIGLTTRRGTNAFHGSVHSYLESHKMESQNLPAELANDPRVLGSIEKGLGSDTILGDHIQQLGDYGGDLGGPIVKDKLWFYGSWGKQDIRLRYLDGTQDHTDLTAYNGKLNWQASPNDMISVFYFNSEKVKLGRSPGTGLTEAEGILWDQGNAYAGNLHGLLKFQIDHTFSPDFFVSAKYAHFDAGFGLTPKNGIAQSYTLDYNNGTAYGNFYQYSTVRPNENVNIDASYFKQAWGASHELKFGFGYRKFTVTSTTTFGGNGLAGYIGGGGPTGSVAEANRNTNITTENEYYSGYVSDTITKDRLTMNVGLRYDHQSSANQPSNVPAVQALPDVLPAVNYVPQGPAITWNSFSPRAGFTLALDDARKTILRANFAYYGSQMGTATGSQTNGAFTSFAVYPWTPTAADGGFPLPNELDLSNPLATGNINLANPSSQSPNTVDPNYGPQRDMEVIGGLEREVNPNVTVSATYTWREGTNLTGWTPLQGVTSADYVPTVDPGPGNGYSSTYYSLAPNIATPAGTVLTNRPDYHTNYSGVEVNLIKRLSSKWMARVGFTYGKPTETLEGPGAVQNPSKTGNSTIGASGQFAPSGPQINGGLLAPYSSGSGKGYINIESDWQVVANALVQLPWDMELSGAFFIRQGTPLSYIFQETTSNGILNVLTNQNQTLDAVRYPDVSDLDLHLAKNIHFGTTSLVVSADCFNIFNSNTTTQEIIFASSSNLGVINKDGTLNPRIFRLGLRFRF